MPRCHPADAMRLGFPRRPVIGKFTAAAGTATLPVISDDKVARGTVWIEAATAPPPRWEPGAREAGRA
jgi:NADH-quinone oxidoreductase subunit G